MAGWRRFFSHRRVVPEAAQRTLRMDSYRNYRAASLWLRNKEIHKVHFREAHACYWCSLGVWWQPTLPSQHTLSLEGLIFSFDHPPSVPWCLPQFYLQTAAISYIIEINYTMASRESPGMSRTKLTLWTLPALPPNMLFSWVFLSWLWYLSYL